MYEGVDLEIAIQSLDEQGWNSLGRVQRSSFARLFMQSATIAEEILEISLGPLPHEEIISRAAELERRAIEHQNNLPEFLRLDDQPFIDIKRQPIELLYMAYIRLDALHHHFLLQRTLVKKIGVSNAKLVAISQEMFSFVVKLVNNMGILRDFQLDVIQVVTMDGIPSAAIIAMELLHQEQNPNSASALSNPLPRSSTIQDLSVFVACLGTVKSFTNASAICTRGRKFLKKILDTILDPAPARPVVNESSVRNLGDPMLTGQLFQTMNDGDFLQWLDNMDYENESWVNFN